MWPNFSFNQFGLPDIYTQILFFSINPDAFFLFVFFPILTTSIHLELIPSCSFLSFAEGPPDDGVHVQLEPEDVVHARRLLRQPGDVPHVPALLPGNQARALRVQVGEEGGIFFI